MNQTGEDRGQTPEMQKRHFTCNRAEMAVRIIATLRANAALLFMLAADAARFFQCLSIQNHGRSWIRFRIKILVAMASAHFEIEVVPGNGASSLLKL